MTDALTAFTASRTGEPRGLIRELQAQGVRFRIEQGQIHVHAPQGVMTPRRTERLRALRGEWLAATEDPRPDLAEDTARWRRLLLLAWPVAGDMWEVLRGFRACGALLQVGHGTLRLVPLLDPSERQSVWQGQADWEEYRAEWLLPRATVLRQLLRGAYTREETSEGGPPRQT